MRFSLERENVSLSWRTSRITCLKTTEGESFLCLLSILSMSLRPFIYGNKRKGGTQVKQTSGIATFYGGALIRRQAGRGPDRSMCPALSSGRGVGGRWWKGKHWLFFSFKNNKAVLSVEAEGRRDRNLQQWINWPQGARLEQKQIKNTSKYEAGYEKHNFTSSPQRQLMWFILGLHFLI